MTDWLNEVKEVSKELDIENIPQEWNAILLDAFYHRPYLKLFNEVYRLAEKYELTFDEIKERIIFPSFFAQNMPLLRFISGYVPRLAKVLYSHTEKDIPKILAWMKGRKFKCVREGKAIIESADKEKTKRDIKHKMASGRILQERWDRAKSGNWQVCK